MRLLRVFLCLAIAMPLAVSEQVGADEPPPWYTPALDEEDGQYVPVTPTIVPVVWETGDPQFSSYDNVCRVSLWALVEREDVYFSSFANTWGVRAVGFTTEGVPRLGQVSVHGPDRLANRIASISFPYLYRADRFHNDGPVDRRPESPVYIDLSSSYGFRFFTQGEEWNDGDTNPCEPLLASIPDRIAEFSAQAQFVRERRDDEVDPQCTVEQSGTDGATLSFESAVPGSVGYLQEWTFSDGSTSTANSVSKVATEPGPYSGTFRVYRTDGSLDKSITCTAEIKSPTPSVDVRLVHDDASNESGRFALDEEFDVVVAASAANDGVGDITATQLDVTKLFDQAPNLEVLSGPTPALVNPLTLVSGAIAQEFTYRVKAVGPGRFRVDAAMTAMRDGVDRPVADVDVMRNGSVGSITLAAVATPESVELEEGDDGPEPKPVTVTVKITNPFDVPLTDIKLAPVEPRLVANRPPPIDYRAFNYFVGGQPGIPAEVNLGTLANKGDFVEHEFTGSAVDAGSIDLEFLARATSDGSPIAGAVTVRVEIVTDVDFVFDAAVDETSTIDGPAGESGNWVTGGETWLIDGSFENRTIDKTLLVLVQPDRRGNSGFGVPIPTGTAAPDVVCGIGVAQVLEPGASIDFVAPVPTTKDGATRSEIRYEPQVFEVTDDGTRSIIDPARVLVTPGADVLTVSVDVREPTDTEPSYGELSLVYGVETIDAIYATGVGLASLGVEAFGRGVQFWNWPAAYLAAGDKVAEYLDHLYDNLSPADRELWLTEWSSALALATGMALTDARDVVDTQVLETFTELNTAWETGDSRAIAAWWGKLTGENIDAVLGGVTKAYGVCKLLRNRSFAKRALLRADRELAKEVADTGVSATARSFPTGGIIDRAARRNIWGIDDVMNAKVQQFVDDFNIIIGVRRRGPGSLAKIEAGTHIPKPYHNKAKNISQIDVDYFGFADDLDTASIAQPPLLGELDIPSSISKDRRAEIVARHKTRMEEWYGKGVDVKTGAGGEFTTSERYKWAQFATPGIGIPVPRKGAPLDYTQNVSAGRSVPPDDALYRRVPAELKETILKDGRSQFTLKIDIEGNGNFKPSTGDMDPVIVGNPDFSTLSEIERIKFYERAYELGFEHVESASWNNPAGRNGYLEDHSVYNPNSEAIFTWMPKQRPRATRFDPLKSWADPADLRLEAALIYLRGANVQLKTSNSVVGDLNFDTTNDDAAYTSPKTIFFVDPNCKPSSGALSAGFSSAALTSTCSVEFDRGPGAVILRQTATGGIDVWTEVGGWVPFSGSSSSRVGVLPQSVVTEGGAASATRLEIASQADLETTAGDEWFAVGDVVVIDPGGPNQETATISGFGSLIFAEPLQFPHPAGTTVSVLRAQTAPAPTTTLPSSPTTPAPSPTTPPTTTVPMNELPATGGGSATGTILGVAFGAILLGVVLLLLRRRRSSVRWGPSVR